MQYSRDAAENTVIGPPLVLVPGSVPGRLKSIPVFDNGEVAAIAGGVGGDDDDNDDDDDDDNNDNDNNNDDDDEDGDDKEEKKPSGGGIKLVPRAERRRKRRLSVGTERERRRVIPSKAFGNENRGRD